MMTEYYPVVNWGYSGTAMIHGSKVGGMYNDNLRGMPTFNEMYVAQ
jgi:peptide/nickel transport system substrate-binding protein